MSEFLAGFAKAEITPHNLGFPLMGYSNRKSGATGIHDPLYARAMAVKSGDAAWALCSVDLLLVTAATVAEVRERVSKATGLEPTAVMVAATHTHSGPLEREPGNWNRPFAEMIAEVTVNAWESMRPARMAHGAGFLYGHSINRRWFERPVDPGVGVIRVDDRAGRLMGIVANFACHPVVMGYDSFLISADYVGYATSAVENVIGGLCLFTNGGCADVNPMTTQVKQQMEAGARFTTMAPAARYYGISDDAIPIEDRAGGTFPEAEVIGLALAHELVAVARGLETQEPNGTPWSAQAWVNHLDEGEELLETQALGIGDFALVTQPGEVFVESALAAKAGLRRLGYRYPWLVSYANDWRYYLAPEAAFPEGGYEVNWALKQKHSPKLQQRFWAAIEPLIPARE